MFALIACFVFIRLISLCHASQAKYDYVFGYSTGHVGTTSLSSKELYEPTDHLVFKFESHSMNHQKWHHWNYEDEYRYVSSVVVPHYIAWRGQKTFIDLGHDNLYFFEALVQRLNELNMSYIFIRIRRSRYEAALSLTYKTDIKDPYSDMCQLRMRYCPYDRSEDIINKISNDTWKSWTVFQQALWQIDEVEARWQRALRIYPNLSRHEVIWGNDRPNSMIEVILDVAKILNTTFVNDTEIIESVQKKKRHTPAPMKNISSEIHSYKQQEEAYLRSLRLSNSPLT